MVFVDDDVVVEWQTATSPNSSWMLSWKKYILHAAQSLHALQEPHKLQSLVSVGQATHSWIIVSVRPKP